jgi:hypothetical protein
VTAAWLVHHRRSRTTGQHTTPTGTDPDDSCTTKPAPQTVPANASPRDQSRPGGPCC